MNILLFSTLYPSAARPQHGIFVETRLRHLLATGRVAARVVAPCPWFPIASPRFGSWGGYAAIPAVERRHGIDIEHPRYPLLPKIGMATAPLALAGALLPALRRATREGRDFDLIDAHYFYPDGVAAVLLGLALRRPVVITARGSDLNVIAEYAVPRRWIAWAAAHAAGLVTVSEALKERLVGVGVAGDRIEVLRNGVDLALFHPLPRSRSDRRRLLAVGNLVPLKGHLLLVEALALLPDAELVIAGAGPERGRLERRAAELAVADRLRLVGRVAQADLPALYGAADMLLLPSAQEGSPNVLLEAMACGTPVIAADIPGIDELVRSPDAGRLLRERSPEAIAEAVAALAAEPPDRARVRAYAERFGWEETTHGQIALFERVLAARRSTIQTSARPRRRP